MHLDVLQPCLDEELLPQSPANVYAIQLNTPSSRTNSVTMLLLSSSDADETTASESFSYTEWFEVKVNG